MKVLYIAYTKCGTKSMRHVFKTLGYKCYDWEENFLTLGHDWEEIFNKGATPERFKKMYADVDACVDHPVYHFWEEILEAFPDTKLLVRYRDEDSWVKSFENQCDAIASNYQLKILSMLSPTSQKMMALGRNACCHVWGGDRNAWPWDLMTRINYTLMRKRYRKHNLNIQTNAPKGQLHVVDFDEGWEPICKFLGKPVPDVPFPHANKGATALEESMATHPIFVRIFREAVFSFIVLTCLLAIGVFYMIKIIS